MAEQPQRHLRITTGAMPRYCLIPGDPARAERIAARFDGSEETIRNREFLGFRGMVVTDALNMAGVANAYGAAAGAVFALILPRRVRTEES